MLELLQHEKSCAGEHGLRDYTHCMSILFTFMDPKTIHNSYNSQFLCNLNNITMTFLNYISMAPRSLYVKYLTVSVITIFITYTPFTIVNRHRRI